MTYRFNEHVCASDHFLQNVDSLLRLQIQRYASLASAYWVILTADLATRSTDNGDYVRAKVGQDAARQRGGPEAL